MPFIAPAIAAVAGAIGSAATFIGGLGIVGKALVGIGINLAVGFISKKLAGKPEEPVGGVQFDRQYGANLQRQVAMGFVGIAGHDCYINTFGQSNNELQQIYVVSDYFCDGLQRVAINGEWVLLTDIENAEKGFTVATGDFVNLIWFKFFNGRQTTANAYLTARANPSGRWSAQHVGVGLSFVLVSMTFEKEKNNQFPDFFFEIRGAPLYDWRFDSSVGGSGPQRWNNPATHVFSENPIVMEYNYRRGLSVNGDMFCGMGMSAADLPLDKWTIAANICDENVSNTPRYRCSVMVDCMATHGRNIESFAMSCGSMNIDSVSGSWPLVGSSQPIVATFTDDDLVSNEKVRYRARRSMSELVNSISGNFPNPDNLWSMDGYEPQISQAGLVLDRRTRDLSMDFPQVRSARQAAQLASIYLKENRYEATASLTLRPRFQGIEPGDWVRWNSERYGNKVYIVTDTSLARLSSNKPRAIALALQERDGSIYDGVTPPQIILPFPPGRPQYLQEVQNFDARAVIVQGNTGSLAPAIRVSWSVIEDETVSAVLVQYWTIDDPSQVFTKRVDMPASVAILTEGVVGGTEYRVRTVLITDPLRPVAPSAGALVTTDDIDPDFYPINLEDLGVDVRDYQEYTGGLFRELLRRTEELELRISERGFGDRYERKQLIETVKATYDTTTAEYTKKITVIATENSALAERLETLNAIVVDPETGVTATATAVDVLRTEINGYDIDGRLIAMAAAVTSISAATDPNNVNTANFAMEVVSGPAGYSRIAFLARAGGAGGYRVAGQYTDVPNNPALPIRTVFDVQQFIITDSGSAVMQPFLFSGGELTVRDLKVYFAQIVGTLQGNRIDARTITADRLILNGITYTEIQNGGVTANASYDQTASISTTPNNTDPTVIVAQLTMNGITGRRREIRFSCSVSGSGSGVMEAIATTVSIRVTIRRGNQNGPIIREIAVPLSCYVGDSNTPNQYSYSFGGQVFLECLDLAGAANQLYTVQLSRQGGTNSHGTQASSRFMSIDEYRA